MEKIIKIEDATREQIAAFLPEAITLAVASYREHMSKAIEDGKFESHHKSAKVAISHIELLIKLARWADLPDKQDEDAMYLSGLMAAAEAEVQSYQGDD